MSIDSQTANTIFLITSIIYRLKKDLKLNQLPDQALYLSNTYDAIDPNAIESEHSNTSTPHAEPTNVFTAVLTRDEFNELNFDDSVVVTYGKPPLTCRLERARRSPTPEV